MEEILIPFRSDVVITWSVKRLGIAEDFSNKNVKVFLKDQFGKDYDVDFTISANKITIQFPGRLQTKQGRYSAYIIENDGMANMATFVNKHAFILTDRDCCHISESRDSSGKYLVDLASDFIVPSNGIGIASINAVTSSADDGLNVITIVLDNGTTKTFNVKNGSRGLTDEERANLIAATNDATDAAETATQAVANANTAISNANEATSEANTATMNANAAASSANKAAKDVADGMYLVESGEINEPGTLYDHYLEKILYASDGSMRTLTSKPVKLEPGQTICVDVKSSSGAHQVSFTYGEYKAGTHVGFKNFGSMSVGDVMEWTNDHPVATWVWFGYSTYRIKAKTTIFERCLEVTEGVNTAIAGAEKVNASLDGAIFTVTDRDGNSTSFNTKGEKGEQGEQGATGQNGQDADIAGCNAAIAAAQEAVQSVTTALQNLQTYIEQVNNQLASAVMFDGANNN